MTGEVKLADFGLARTFPSHYRPAPEADRDRDRDRDRSRERDRDRDIDAESVREIEIDSGRRTGSGSGSGREGHSRESAPRRRGGPRALSSAVPMTLKVVTLWYRSPELLLGKPAFASYSLLVCVWGGES